MKTLVGVALVLASVAQPLSARAQSFPDQALGFTFGAPAEPVCLAAGGTWTPGDTYSRCSVVPSPIGHEGIARVDLCADGVSTCGVAFTSTASPALLAVAWSDLLRALVRRYGAGRASSTGREACAAAFVATPSESTLECIAAGHGQVRHTWRVGGGAVHLQVGAGETGPLALMLMYMSPRQRAESEAERHPVDDRSL